MKTISERIKEALEIRGMKQSELVEKTGIGKSSISTYISGSYEPKQRNLYKIAKALDVDVSWLMGNDVAMETQKTEGGFSNYEIARLITRLKKDSQLQEFLQIFDSLDESNKETIMNLLKALGGND